MVTLSKWIQSLIGRMSKRGII